MSAYDNLKCVSIGTEKKMGFERDEFIERTEKQKMWLYTGGAFDRGCDRGDPCSNLNSNFQRAASQGACGCRLGKSASILFRDSGRLYRDRCSSSKITTSISCSLQ